MIRSLESRLAKLEDLVSAGERIQFRRLLPDSKRTSYTECDQRGNVIFWIDERDERI